MKYDYAIVALGATFNTEEDQAELDRMGALGYHVVGVTSGDRVIMEREVNVGY